MKTAAGSDSLAWSGEDALIARYFRPLACELGALGLEDDAALLAVRDGHELVVTVDAIVAGVHFFPNDPPGDVARKALRVNLSDLAAKGAAPRGFVLTLALAEADEAWLSAFAAALGEDAQGFACPLLGGDTVKTPGPLTISITAFGEVAKGTMVRRATARPGDIIVVSGTIGDAALGLRLLRGELAPPLDREAERDLIARYRRPQPRLALGPVVAAFFRAAMDVSDGLVGDLSRLCRASQVSARVRLDDVPLSPAARGLRAAAGPAFAEWVYGGGDDYEILGTLDPAKLTAAQDAARAAGVPLTAIGEILPGRAPAQFLDAAGQAIKMPLRPYSHF